jgi:hypothetical protein
LAGAERSAVEFSAFKIAAVSGAARRSPGRAWRGGCRRFNGRGAAAAGCTAAG